MMIESKEEKDIAAVSAVPPDSTSEKSELGQPSEETDSNDEFLETSPSTDDCDECSSEREEQKREAGKPVAEVEPDLTVQDRLENIETVLQELNERTAEANRSNNDAARTREALFEKLDASKHIFMFNLVRPIVTRLASLRDLIASLYAHPPQEPDAYASNLKSLLTYIDETVALNGIERISPEVGKKFDSRFHYVVDIEPTNCPDKHDTIARFIMDGYVYWGQTERDLSVRPSVISPARVVTYSFKAPESKLASETNVEPTKSEG